jgi:predicted membrane protein DUF2339
VVGLTLGLLGRLMRAVGEERQPQEAELFSVLLGGISLLALCGLSVELYSSFRWWAIPSPGSWNAGAWFALASLWSVFAVGLLHLGLLSGEIRLRKLAYGIGAAAVVVLLTVSLNGTVAGWMPLVNLRFFAFLVAANALATAPSLIGPRRQELPTTERELVSDSRLLLLPVLVGLWGLTQETYETFRCLSGYFGEHWDRAAQMGISLVWTLCGVLVLIGGIVRRFQPVRLLALGLLGLTVTKVFLFDLGFLDTSYRILSFGGLGLALIGISWLYSRYGRLRA